MAAVGWLVLQSFCFAPQPQSVPPVGSLPFGEPEAGSLPFQQQNNTVKDVPTSSIPTTAQTVKRSWRRTDIVGPSPKGRTGHIAVSWNNKMLIFGGYDGYGPLNDLWSLDFQNMRWSELEDFNGNGSPPSCRNGHSGVVSKDGKLIIFGGKNKKLERVGDTFMYDIENRMWTNITSPVLNPLGRDNHAAVINSAGKMIVFGGFLRGEGNDAGFQNDMWVLDTGSSSWRQVEYRSKKRPSPRVEHSAVINAAGKMFMFGGRNYKWDLLNDLWLFELSRAEWVELSSVDGVTPSPRSMHSAVMSMFGRMFIYGGIDATYSYLKDTWQYDTVKNEWKLVMPLESEIPTARHYHSACMMPIGKLAMFGGYDGHFNNEVWIMDTGSATDRPAIDHVDRIMAQTQAGNTQILQSQLPPAVAAAAEKQEMVQVAPEEAARQTRIEEMRAKQLMLDKQRRNDAAKEEQLKKKKEEKEEADRKEQARLQKEQQQQERAEEMMRYKMEAQARRQQMREDEEKERLQEQKKADKVQQQQLLQQQQRDVEAQFNSNVPLSALADSSPPQEQSAPTASNDDFFSGKDTDVLKNALRRQ